MLIGLFPSRVQWPRSVEAYPPPALRSGSIFTGKSRFYKSPHFFSTFSEPLRWRDGQTQTSDFTVQKGDIKDKRRWDSCLLSCAWDDEHWEAFIWVLFSRFTLHKDEQWTSLILCKRFWGFSKSHNLSWQFTNQPMGSGCAIFSHPI